MLNLCSHKGKETEGITKGVMKGEMNNSSEPSCRCFEACLDPHSKRTNLSETFEDSLDILCDFSS